MKHKLANSLVALPRLTKRLVSSGFDLSMSLICTFLTLKFNAQNTESLFTDQSVIIAILIGALQVGALWSSGTYQTVARFLSLRSLAKSIYYLFTVNALIFIVFTLFGLDNISHQFGLGQPALFFCLFFISRICVAVLLAELNKNTSFNNPKTKIALIYGAGDAGRQLAMALLQSKDTEVVGFLDDDPSMQGAIIQSLKVHPTQSIQSLIKQREITHVLLALPSANRSTKSVIIKTISAFGVKVLTLPTLSELAEGKITFNDLKEVQIEDLLAREIAQPNEILLNKNIRNQVVLVTGAGGSIGSELCRQVIKRSPSKIVLVEVSEAALYIIDSELNDFVNRTKSNCVIVSRLCNVQDDQMIDHIIFKENPDTFYHAAAYKHVPLVEVNICEGILNNVLGTLNCLNSSIKHGVKQFILVSTDKAVRPTNVMGASKRIAEMILQANAHLQPSTKISMVRFGNVLGSSGSVVPRFRQQIASGGPITLTHEGITRFFMTIPEATQLVIQAGALGGSGEVFLLDMGEPIKIIDLAKKMVELSGLKVKEPKVKDRLKGDGDGDGEGEGDIEIKITGLRPGEKLFEELLIGETPIPTSHPDIYMGLESFLPKESLLSLLDELLTVCKNNDSEKAYSLAYEITKSQNPFAKSGTLI
jgi:FlaA1/EpsC-like NDP-sugar epimerase